MYTVTQDYSAQPASLPPAVSEGGPSSPVRDSEPVGERDGDKTLISKIGGANTPTGGLSSASAAEEAAARHNLSVIQVDPSQVEIGIQDLSKVKSVDNPGGPVIRPVRRKNRSTGYRCPDTRMAIAFNRFLKERATDALSRGKYYGLMACIDEEFDKRFENVSNWTCFMGVSIGLGSFMGPIGGALMSVGIIGFLGTVCEYNSYGSVIDKAFSEHEELGFSPRQKDEGLPAQLDTPDLVSVLKLAIKHKLMGNLNRSLDEFFTQEDL